MSFTKEVFEYLLQYGVVGIVAFYGLMFFLKKSNTSEKHYDKMFDKMIDESATNMNKMEKLIEEVNKSLLNHNLNMVKSSDSIELKLRTIEDRIELKNEYVNKALSELNKNIDELNGAITRLNQLLGYEEKFLNAAAQVMKIPNVNIYPVSDISINDNRTIVTDNINLDTSEEEPVVSNTLPSIPSASNPSKREQHYE